MKILLAAATEAEIAPTLAQLKGPDGNTPPYPVPRGEVAVCITGVGLMAATFALTKALLQDRYDFVLQAGIGGAFDQQLPLGSLVVAAWEALGDLGAEDREAFIDIFELGFGAPDAFPFTAGQLVNPMNFLPFPCDLPRVGSLTVHTVSGHAPTIARRAARYGADIESMEGAALHYVCLQLGVPFLQLRAASNYVTPRDRSAWQIGKAVQALNAQLLAWLAPGKTDGPGG